MLLKCGLVPAALGISCCEDIRNRGGRGRPLVSPSTSRGGTRHWPLTELRKVKTWQFRMTRPRSVGGGYTQFACRSACWAESFWQEAQISAWDEAITGTWWRWPGHVARLNDGDPTHICGIVVGWKGTWWRKTLRGVLLTDSDPHRNRLDRRHRRVGKWRRDDPIQRHAEECMGHQNPWQVVATNRARCAELEAVRLVSFAKAGTSEKN